ncbi:unnamed protein product [Darwinula stevensoni]|uniref:Sodium/calcium exchanger membrane region domain-containing protein n=1 Tax=Darwinula stevensoni TaxID=69355 RepID=A0A7R9FQJ7_9CRUS|nr:unnamed protein product [Darwinula stevensoni]CAG0899627.1 unnamed protein product [Darwinula stevensoni]
MKRLARRSALFRVSSSCIFYFIVFLTYRFFAGAEESPVSDEEEVVRSRHLLSQNSNCTPPAIEEFPGDFLSPSQRNRGGVVIHFLIGIYLFVAIAIVCDEYFVPSLDVICKELHMSSDIGGASLMAAGSSSPELFTNLLGTFLTEGDIGLGTIVGSAVFNILGVVILCVMVFNPSIELWVKKKVSEWGWKLVATGDSESDGEQTPILSRCSLEEGKNSEPVAICNGWCPPGLEEEGSLGWRIYWTLTWPIRLIFFFTIPDCRKKRWRKFYIVAFISCLIWIGVIAYLAVWMITIIGRSFPTYAYFGKCEKKQTGSKMHLAEHVINENVSPCSFHSLGYTLGIPDTVMGLTFLAVGTSVPEMISSFIVARQGEEKRGPKRKKIIRVFGLFYKRLGTMCLSNAVGSNTFDILVCLGLPWFVKAAFLPSDPTTKSIRINSEGIIYSAIALLSSLIILYLALFFNRFVLNRRVGSICFILYIIFLVFSLLWELNVFGIVNLPTCPSSA